ncbi:MAG TPA: hypothetical protein VE778_00365 [Candidatus Bathyarchaeia archaeon]|nr:hypothetical protein [Candidatus Bathyarchaeia archaeon]
MKKLLFAALFLPAFVFALMALGPRADQRREFISQTMNSDVQRLLDNGEREMIAQEPFSSKNNNIPDHMIGFYNTDHGLLVTLQALKQHLDEYGRSIPDVYSSELVAIVFVDKSLLWFESEAAKDTLKAEMARLMGKQFV